MENEKVDAVSEDFVVLTEAEAYHLDKDMSFIERTDETGGTIYETVPVPAAELDAFMRRHDADDDGITIVGVHRLVPVGFFWCPNQRTGKMEYHMVLVSKIRAVVWTLSEGELAFMSTDNHNWKPDLSLSEEQILLTALKETLNNATPGIDMSKPAVSTGENK